MQSGGGKKDQVVEHLFSCVTSIWVRLLAATVRVSSKGKHFKAAFETCCSRLCFEEQPKSRALRADRKAGFPSTSQARGCGRF